MTKTEKRWRKKRNHKYGAKAVAARTARAEAHAARCAASIARKQVETDEVDDFLGAPIVKQQEDVVASVDEILVHDD